MKIGDLARHTGLTAHTIRYYERIGLLPRARRDGSKQRDYDPSILIWIEFIGRLKTTGMPIADMLTYAALRDAGPHTANERSQLLQVHRERVRAYVADLQVCLLTLDAKIETYAKSQPRTDIDAKLQRNPLRARRTRTR